MPPGSSYRKGGAVEVVLIFALAGVLAGLSAAFGTDSRDGEDWFTHRRA